MNLFTLLKFAAVAYVVLNPSTVLFVLLAMFFISNPSSIKETFLPVYTYLVGSHDRLYRLLSTVKAAFERSGIPYSISGKVLLSAVTKGKLTRGDSTGTILVPRNHISRVLELSNAFLQQGLGFNDLPDGTFQLGSSMSLPFISDTSVQIVPITWAGDRWISDSRLQGLDEWYHASDLFPTKMYNLGELTLPGPQNPVPYLRRNFWSVPQTQVVTVLPTKTIVDRGQWGDYSYYGSDINEVNGIYLDPRPYPNRQTVLLGNAQPKLIPRVGVASPTIEVRPKKSIWRKYLWGG
jgi:hypothetical protein